MSNEMIFDLEPEEVPVTIKGERYILREATGKAAVAYRNAMLNCTTLGPDGKPQKIKGLASVEPMLVSMCLFKEGTNKTVPQHVVESWPDRVQKSLYKRLKEISDLEEPGSPREQLYDALCEEGSPVSLEDLHEFVKDLGEDYEDLEKYLRPTAKERAKNSQMSSTDGSD